MSMVYVYGMCMICVLHLPTVGGEHTHNDYSELPTKQAVADMLATEEAVSVWRALETITTRHSVDTSSSCYLRNDSHSISTITQTLMANTS